MSIQDTQEQLIAEIKELRLQLEEANDTIETIRAINNEHFILLANNIPQITWTNLPSGQFNFFNKCWYDYTGLSVGAGFDESWDCIIHTEDLPATRERFSSCMKSGEIFEIEHRYKRNDGIYRWYLNRSIPLRNETGEILFWVGTATDIDDQRKAIEKKDEFIGIASHELKTPLTSLKAYLQLISNYKKEPVPSQVKTFIVKAESSINKLQILVNDLLDVRKIQAGKLHFSQYPLSVNELISNCAENAGYMFPDYNIIYKPGVDINVNGNTERLEQVIMNLIHNAVKYSPLNKDIILSFIKEGSQVRISVTDYGIGLSANQNDKIFERFYQIDGQSFMAGGLGMGLYISMEIIKNHKGTIGVQSRINKGSTFYILLPLLP
jgi:two-component system phosphate regulon sensor histidine kinase PhoR